MYIPTMTLRIISQYAIEYMGILSRHADTLTHLGLSHWFFFDCIDQTQNDLGISSG